MSNEMFEVIVSVGVGSGEDVRMDVNSSTSLKDVFLAALQANGVVSDNLEPYGFSKGVRTIRRDELANTMAEPNGVYMIQATNQKQG